MTNLDRIFKSRVITLSTKVHLAKAMVFPVVMYGRESWIIKKAEQWRIDAFELWCWRRLLSPLGDSKEIQPVHSEGDQPWDFFGRNDAKAETQYFGHLKRRADSLEKPLMLGLIGGRGEGDDRGWDGLMASLTQWTWVWVDSGHWCWQGGLACCGSWGRKELDTTETELNYVFWFL